eukprot:2605138-Amphidinium_carterae.1
MSLSYKATIVINLLGLGAIKSENEKEHRLPIAKPQNPSKYERRYLRSKCQEKSLDDPPSIPSY